MAVRLPNARPAAVFALDPPRGGGLRRLLHAAAARPLEWLFALTHLERVYRAVSGGELDDFLAASLERLGVTLEVTGDEHHRIPAAGPLLVVANHPFGGLEGLALARLLRQVRGDVKVLANSILARIPELRELFIFVDPWAPPAARQDNARGVRDAMRWLAAGGALVVFPAGEVSHLDLRRRAVVDPKWQPAVARLVRWSSAAVLPVFFPGHNGIAFQAAGLLHPMLRTALLPRALLRRRNRRLEIRVGRPISPETLAGLGDDGDLLGFLRARTEILGLRRTHRNGPAPPPAASRLEPLAAAEPAEALAAELDALPEERVMVRSGDHLVLLARAGEIPRTLLELGRLRELTFRLADEGTGRARDLDRFDDDYLHLLLWNRAARELLGGYRLGPSDVLLERRGTSGLYTSTLFDYRPGLFARLGPALEMGRSFVRPEAQRSYGALALLWRGIGAFVAANPRYRILFGPVSISPAYQGASQRLMVRFLREHHFAAEWAHLVRPRRPVRGSHGVAPRYTAWVRDVEDVSQWVAHLEPDAKGMPVLLRQYLKLGGRLLGFNVDPDFSHVVDGLILVDLALAERRTLERFMGRDQAAAFLAVHAADLPAAG